MGRSRPAEMTPVDHRLLLRARRVDKRFPNRRSMVRRVIGTVPAVEAVSPNYTEARQNLKSLMDAAVDNRVTVIITRRHVSHHDQLAW